MRSLKTALTRNCWPTSQENGRTSAMLLSTESLDEDDIKEDESFSTQQLFQFAWQIAKGMVILTSAL